MTSGRSLRAVSHASSHNLFANYAVDAKLMLPAVNSLSWHTSNRLQRHAAESLP